MKTLFLGAFTLASFLALFSPLFAQPGGSFDAPLPPPPQASKTVTLFGFNLGCDPSRPPNPPPNTPVYYPYGPNLPGAVITGCGISHFVNLINAVIRFLTRVVVLPLAVLMLVWAGFVIITAGGSPEKVKKGRAIITTAVVGVVIALLAGAIVGIIFELMTGQKLP